MIQIKNLPKEWLILIVIVILIAVISFSDWKKSENSKPQGSSVTIDIKPAYKQEKEEGNVTVTVEYLKDKSDDKTISFSIALNTHSVELDKFDFKEDVVLEKDGKSISSSKASTSGSDHHRSAEITFSNTPPPLTIVLKNLAGIEKREFRFEKF